MAETGEQQGGPGRIWARPTFPADGMDDVSYRRTGGSGRLSFPRSASGALGLFRFARDVYPFACDADGENNGS